MLGRAPVGLDRRAARLAALVAVPVALVAGMVAYRILDSRTTAAGPPATTPVALPAPRLDERPAAVCRALFAKLPDHFGALPRRPVTAGPEQNAAYGDPPVTLTCGVPGPSAPPGAQFVAVGEACWYYRRDPARATWSLAGYEVPVVVAIPERYPGEDLIDLSGPIAATVPATAARPC